MRQYKQFYINGKWVDPISPNEFEVINPADESIAGIISLGSKSDVDDAVAAARTAFGEFSQFTQQMRIELLETILATHENPTYSVDGIIHYCVENMPDGVARTSTLALTNATLPYVINLADQGINTALMNDKHLLNGLNIHNGNVTIKAVAENLGYPYIPPAQALEIDKKKIPGDLRQQEVAWKFTPCINKFHTPKSREAMLRANHSSHLALTTYW